MNLIFILLAVFITYYKIEKIQSDQLKKQKFLKFGHFHERHYSQENDTESQNYDHVKSHNTNGSNQYRLRLNKFSDLKRDEFLKNYTGLKISKTNLSKRQLQATASTKKLTTTGTTNRISTTRTTNRVSTTGTTNRISTTRTTNRVSTTGTTNRISTTRTTNRVSTTGTTNRISTTRTTNKLSTTATTKKLSTTTKKSAEIQEIDWRIKGAVTSVKDQKACGSCWSFSANGALESQYLIKKKLTLDLSEQNLVDCSSNSKFGNFGCDGGSMPLAFEYIKVNGGINNETIYPYEAVQNACRYKSDHIAATVKGYVELPSGDEQALEEAVRDIGPVSVGVDASTEFSLYESGVLLSTACTTNINHGVLVVGFNNTHVPPYWIIKNTWDTTWGEDGYIRIEKGKNACGIAEYCSYPII